MATTATEVPPATDYDEIVRVVQLYVDGFNDCDISKLREAFHEDAWIFWIQPDGCLFKNRIADEFEAWMGEGPRIVGRIISVTQAGDVASVLLGFDVADEPGAGCVEFHTLLCIDGVWKITNKTAVDCTRAAWAAREA